MIVITILSSLYATSSQIFSEYKQQRKLVLIPQVGTVHLELEFDERKVDFHVSPPHATVIMAFTQQGNY
jgi:anaphase-promoting complex subunit 2